MSDPEILYEDKNFAAVLKPAGLVVHGVKLSGTRRAASGMSKKKDLNPDPTLVDWLVKRYPEIKTVGDDPEMRPGIVHRLDKETSGVMLVARNQEYFEYLKNLFKSRAVVKVYWAVVRGVPKKSEGVIDAPIGIKNGTLKRSVHSEKMKKDAVTEYKVLKKFNPEEGESGSAHHEILAAYALLEIRPKTGRTHQIRVHLASIGHPIVGDPLYGPKRQPPWASRLMLYATSISFMARPGKMITIEAPTGEEFGI